MSNKFNIFLLDNPCRKVGLVDSQLSNEELVKSTLVVIFWFKRTSDISSSWYLEEGNTMDLETIARVTNILKERTNTINRR